jgi:hypothetical protein
MPGKSAFVGNDGGALDDRVGGIELGEVDGVAAGEAVAAAADGVDPVDDGVDPVDDGDTDAGDDVRAGCVCGGTACGPSAVEPQADRATAAVSGNGSSKGNKRRTRPSSLPAPVSNHGTPFFPACVSHPRNDRG